MTTYHYHRQRKRELPVIQYECSNCGKCFEYFSFAYWRTKSGRNFCSGNCKTEYYYLLHQMSQSQLNVLEYLINNGGHARLLHSRSVASLRWKIAPLVNIVHEINQYEVFAEITANGRKWYAIRQGVKS